MKSRLADRYLDLAVSVVRIVSRLPKSDAGSHIGRQLLRSGTSPGANYEEACGAESRADFCHKMGIVLKELKETRFWLRLAARSDLIDHEQSEVLLQEVEELCAITARSIQTARRNQNSRP